MACSMEKHFAAATFTSALPKPMATRIPCLTGIMLGELDNLNQNGRFHLWKRNLGAGVVVIRFPLLGVVCQKSFNKFGNLDIYAWHLELVSIFAHKSHHLHGGFIT